MFELFSYNISRIKIKYEITKYYYKFSSIQKYYWDWGKELCQV